MTAGYKLILFKFHTVILLLVFVLSPFAITNAKSDKFRFSFQKKTIVLDPGHGGYDKGAKGPDGTFEKTVNMELAQVLAVELGKTYEVVLTRTDDYWVDILTRTAMANHLNADLFISIHTGGSFLHQANGISLYYYEKVSTPAFMPEANSMEGFKNSNLQASWSDIQNRHQKSSKDLAELLLNRINDPPSFKTEIQGAPLMVLEGADMPAVLIEVGYITNPADEIKLNDINILSDISERIKNGIEDFFEKTP